MKSSLSLLFIPVVKVPLFFGAFKPNRELSVAVAVKEEFLFRGILQNLLARRDRPITSILLTSIVFTVWHVGVWDPTVWTFSQIFFASILLGIIYFRSGSIAAVIVLHAAYDAIFSFTPLISSPLNENWGFAPLLSAVALVIYWAYRAKGQSLRGGKWAGSGIHPL